MKHHAAVQSVRKRYISRREEILNNFLRIFFTTAVVPFTLVLVRGVVLHMFPIFPNFFRFFAKSQGGVEIKPPVNEKNESAL